MIDLRHRRSALTTASLAALTVLALSAMTTKAQGVPTPAPIVFFDIAGLDGAKQAAFYRDVFGWEGGPGGTLTVPVFGPTLAGALRTDPPSKVIYVGVDNVTSSLAQVVAHGGKIVRPPPGHAASNVARAAPSPHGRFCAGSARDERRIHSRSTPVFAPSVSRYRGRVQQASSRKLRRMISTLPCRCCAVASV